MATNSAYKFDRSKTFKRQSSNSTSSDVKFMDQYSVRWWDDSHKSGPVTVQVRSNAVSRPNSQRSARFAALQEALLSLEDLPEDHGFHLDKSVARRASDFLGVISANLQMEPPKFFPQDGEAAVFTWDLGSIKRLITVDLDEVDMMDIHRGSFMRCNHAFTSILENQFGQVLKELNAHSTGGTSDSNV